MKIFFDLDGTIVNSQEGILNGLEIAAQMMRIDIKDRNFFLPFIGPPVMESAQKFLNLKEIEARTFTKWFRDYYNRKGKFELNLYNGIEDVFEIAKERGFELSVVTSKPEYQAKDIIRNLKLEEYFEGIFGASLDETRSFKKDVIDYAIDSLNCGDEKIYMIGDRYTDISGAKEMGINSIAVLYGFGSLEELEPLNPDYISKDTIELLEIIKSL